MHPGATDQIDGDQDDAVAEEIVGKRVDGASVEYKVKWSGSKK